MTTDNNDLGNKPHESQAAGTKIFAFKISYADGDFVGRMTGRIEATDEQHALNLVYKVSPAPPTRGKVELLKNQAAARKKPFIALECHKDENGDMDIGDPKSRCKNTGNWIEFCESLRKVVAAHTGDIQVQVMRKLESHNARLVVFSGRLKKNQITLNYCPFCGENITTEYVQEEQI